MLLASGARLRSATSATEVIVVRLPADPEAVLMSGGVAMVAHGNPVEPLAAIVPGHEGSTALGKRYGLPDDPIEVLVTKPGDGALSLGGVVLEVKDAKSLPSSD